MTPQVCGPQTGRPPVGRWEETVPTMVGYWLLEAPASDGVVWLTVGCLALTGVAVVALVLHREHEHEHEHEREQGTGIEPEVPLPTEEPS